MQLILLRFRNWCWVPVLVSDADCSLVDSWIPWGRHFFSSPCNWRSSHIFHYAWSWYAWCCDVYNAAIIGKNLCSRVRWRHWRTSWTTAIGGAVWSEQRLDSSSQLEQGGAKSFDWIQDWPESWCRCIEQSRTRSWLQCKTWALAWTEGSALDCLEWTARCVSMQLCHDCGCKMCYILG